MVFLYYPTKFERIVIDAVSEMFSNRLLKEISGRLVFEDPWLNKDFALLRRKCFFSQEDLDLNNKSDEKNSFYGEIFGSYWRNLPMDLLIMDKGEGELPSCLLTQLVNERIVTEEFEIGDRVAAFGIDSEGMYLMLHEPLRRRVPSEVLKLADSRNIPLQGNENILKKYMSSTVNAALDYILETQEPYILNEFS